MKFHHIGIACRDIEEAKQYFYMHFGVEKESEVIFDEWQDADICMLTMKDGTLIELVSGKAVETRVKRKHYLYHICYTTKSISNKIKEFVDAGDMLVKEPRPAKLFNGQKVAFLMTKSGLIELLENEEQ